MQNGELLVISKDSVSINLSNKTHPDEVKVHFKDPIVIVPCDSGHIDDLQWSCSQGTDGFFYLHISWNVSSTRAIKWSACW